MISRLFGSASRFWEVFRFLAAGGACFVLEYVLLFVLTEYGGLNPLVSAPIAFSAALAANYVLCVHMVFHIGRQTGRQMLLFVLTSAAGLGINQAVMWICIELLGIWYMFAKAAATVIVTIWSYFTKRYVLRNGL